QPRIHDLDRAGPVDELVTSAVHGRHSSLAEDFFDDVPARQGGAYPRVLQGDERLAVDEAERALVRVAEVALLAGFHARPPGQSSISARASSLSVSVLASDENANRRNRSASERRRADDD